MQICKGFQSYIVTESAVFRKYALTQFHGRLDTVDKLF